MDQQTLSATQFGNHAADYLVSPIHASGADLERLATLAAGEPAARALDLGCGAGHASFALARGGLRRIVAYDPAPDMLALVASEATARGAAVETRAGAAEELPFAADSFDLVVTRYSAHHWASVPRALAECARVLVPGGRLIVIDVIAPEVPLLDTALQVVEFLRDASHVRDYRIGEWDAMQRAAGFVGLEVDCWKIQLEFPGWIARIGTPPGRVAALRAVFEEFPAEVRDYFAVDPALSFATDTAWLGMRKPA